MLLNCIFFFLGVIEVNIKNGDILVGLVLGILKVVINFGNIDVSLLRYNNVILEIKEGRLF